VHGLHATSTDLKYANAKAAAIEAARDDKPKLRIHGDNIMIFDKDKVYRLMI